METARPSFDWNTYLWWASLTAVGNSMAVVVISLAVSALRVTLFGATGDEQISPAAALISLVPIFAVGGAIVGFSQWIALRGLISRAGWWILATAAGWMSGYLWAYMLFPPGSAMATYGALITPWLIFGLVSGVLQWLVLRPQYERAIWWIPTSLLAMAIGTTGLMIGGTFGGALMWLIAGAISGLILLRVLYPKPVAQG